MNIKTIKAAILGALVLSFSMAHIPAQAQRADVQSRGLGGRLSLSLNNWDELKDVDLTGVRYLNLSGNNLGTVPKDAFKNIKGVKTLRALSLSDNNITTIEPGAFKGLDGLWVLFLSNNKIEHVQQKALSGMPRLKLIGLYNNPLPQETFKDLQKQIPRAYISNAPITKSLLKKAGIAAAVIAVILAAVGTGYLAKKKLGKQETSGVQEHELTEIPRISSELAWAVKIGDKKRVEDILKKTQALEGENVRGLTEALQVARKKGYQDIVEHVEGMVNREFTHLIQTNPSLLEARETLRLLYQDPSTGEISVAQEARINAHVATLERKQKESGITPMAQIYVDIINKKLPEPPKGTILDDDIFAIRQASGLHDYEPLLYKGTKEAIAAYLSTIPESDREQKKHELFFRAALHGSLQGVNKMLQVGVDVNARNKKDDTTALMWAAARGHTAVVEQLLNVPGIEVNARNEEGDTAFIGAAAHGHAAVVEKLLEAGAKVNAQDHDGDTALIGAAEHGQAAVVERLLKIPGIELNARNRFGRTALIGAAAHGHTAVVEQLLNVPGIEVNARNEGGRALMLAAEYDHAAVVKLLLDDQRLTANRRREIFIEAAEHGYTAVVGELLEDPRINVNAQNRWGENALMWAALHGQAAVVEQLLKDPRINVNAQNRWGENALIWAALASHADVARAGAGAHAAVVEKLLEAGAEVNAQGRSGRTALMWAAYDGHTAVVRELLKHPRINVKARDEGGHTALSLALQRNRSRRREIIDMLKKHQQQE